MNRYCAQHDGWVVEREAVEIRAGQTGPPAYACHECVRNHGLIPLPPGHNATLIGRKDAAPILPGGRP